MRVVVAAADIGSFSAAAQKLNIHEVKIIVEIEAETEGGFDEADIGVVRDNARQLKFRPDSTGFE